MSDKNIDNRLIVDSNAGDENEPLPFVAPCNDLAISSPIKWLKGGWNDCKSAPGLSFMWGLFHWLLSMIITIAAWKLGGWVLLLSMLSGFIFVAPLSAFALYSVSRQVCLGNKPTMKQTLVSARKPFANALIFAIILLIIFLLWARAASMVHVFFPSNGATGLADFLVFLSIGTIVGSIFAAITFSASVFSLPFIANRDVDPVTAVVSSINAVLRNRRTMLVWALVVAFFTMIGFLTGLLGFIFIIPWLGYATWHGYRDALNVTQWPTLPSAEQ
jgi:uncharacterized membrane protein